MKFFGPKTYAYLGSPPLLDIELASSIASLRN